MKGAEYILSRLQANGAKPTVSLFGELDLANAETLPAELLAAAKLHAAEIVKLLRSTDVTRSER